MNIFPGSFQFCTEIDHGRNAAVHFFLYHRKFPMQCLQKFFRSTVESDIPGERNRYVFMFRVCSDISTDLFRFVSGPDFLSRSFDMFYHPSCPDQKIRALKRLFSFLCQGVRCSHTDSNKRHFLPQKDIFGCFFRFPRECFLRNGFLFNGSLYFSRFRFRILRTFYIVCICICNSIFCIICNIFFRCKPTFQIPDTLFQLHAMFFFRSSDHDHLAAGLFCRLVFFQKSSGSSGFFADHPCDVKLVDQRYIHFFRKWPLHT